MVPREVSYQKMIFVLLCVLTAGLWVWSAYNVKTKRKIIFTTFNPVHDHNEDYLAKQAKYLNGARLEGITFWVPAGGVHEGKNFQRRGILYLVPDAKATVVVCHGFMCDKFDTHFVRKTLFSEYNVLVFDFRGHGELVTPDHCCTFGKEEAQDVICAVTAIRERKDIGRLPVVGYGFSMGAVAAIQAQAQRPDLFAALVLDCPYDKSKNVIRRSLDHLKFNLFGYSFDFPGKELLRKFAFNLYVQAFIKHMLKTIAQLDAVSVNTQIYPLNPVKSIRSVSVPCFFIHCLHDDRIHKDAAHELFDNKPGFKRLWVTRGRRHFDSIFYNPDKYTYKVNNFIKGVLSKNLSHKKSSKVHYDTIVNNQFSSLDPLSRVSQGI